MFCSEGGLFIEFLWAFLGRRYLYLSLPLLSIVLIAAFGHLPDGKAPFPLFPPFLLTADFA